MNIIEKLGIDTEKKVITNDAWSGCGGCIYFIIDKDEPLFCGVDNHICSLDENDKRRDVCFEDKIIYVTADLSEKEKVFNEMLEALIDIINIDSDTALLKATKKAHDVIVKATGKSWSQIKELL